MLACLTACGNGDENEITYFDAISENWKAEMAVTLPPPPENNFELEIIYAYTGKENNTNQKVQYNHILEWNNSEHASISSEGDFLPNIEKPMNMVLYDTRILGGYEIGQKWITEVTWVEDGNVKKEKLVFEIQDDK
ncbi:hypothetical protein [Bacillus sp. FJAT-45350]|uniref:hypothetical protein n=1 Tax=Bacillus sp. FJAT-45350 TaxID=2011014 RepID=UPI000BB7A4BF|nr:hypothetical protein [Bacillus sp. FJAT-45350]